MHPESLLFPTLTADTLLTITIPLLHLQENKGLELSHDICRHEPHETSWTMLPLNYELSLLGMCRFVDTKAMKMGSPTTSKE